MTEQKTIKELAGTAEKMMNVLVDETETMAERVVVMAIVQDTFQALQWNQYKELHEEMKP